MRLLISSKIDRLNYIEKIFKENPNIGIEICDYTDPVVLNDSKLFDRIKSRYSSLFETTNIYRTLHGPFFDLNLHATDPSFAELSKKKIQQSINVAQELNCKKIIFHTGYMPIQKNANFIQQVISVHVGYWTSLCDANQNITVCLENMFEENPTVLINILNRCGMPNLKFCFDIGHCAVFSKKSVKHWLGIFSNYLSHVHLSDNNKLEDSHLPLGKGKLRIERILSILENRNQVYTYALEVAGSEKVNLSLDYLKANGYI